MGSNRRVLMARHAGFCFGVKRALSMVEKALKKGDGRPLYTYGPIIHNEAVVEELIERGVRIIPEDLPEEMDPVSFPRGTVILRSHGVTPDVEERLRSLGFDIVDATCPFVKKIHTIVSDHSKKGYKILITGDKDHAEVKGILGCIEGGDDPFTDKVRVIETPEEVEALPWKPGEKVCLVSQTTFALDKFKELVEIVKKKGYDIVCLNTICSATSERQEAASDIADRVDVMIVIGGKHSSNSQKLYKICKEKNPDTFFIQSVSDLDLSVLQSIDSVGITAGASTPDKIIEEVFKTCQQKKALMKC